MIWLSTLVTVIAVVFSAFIPYIQRMHYAYTNPLPRQLHPIVIFPFDDGNRFHRADVAAVRDARLFRRVLPTTN